MKTEYYKLCKTVFLAVFHVAVAVRHLKVFVQTFTMHYGLSSFISTTLKHSPSSVVYWRSVD